MAGTAGIRVMFTGGGTGGHIFPAIAVAEQLREMEPDADILFIGTKKKIEERVVPAAGFKFKSIWISGFSRKSIKENLLFPIKLMVSLFQAIGISMGFRPQVIVATGGYVSGPSVIAARMMGAKVLLIEPNSYPGITTRLLERRAEEIHLMFKDAVQFLRQPEKLFITGNPVRKSLVSINRDEARKKLGLALDSKVVFVVGGSLGARAINKTIAASIKRFAEEKISIIWQTGATSFDESKSFSSENVKVLSFIENMNEVYAASDLVVARAGATTIAELVYLNKPAVLIPFPFAAENHQLMNAKSMVELGTAVLIEEKEIDGKLFSEVVSLLSDGKRIKVMVENLEKAGGKDAAFKIAGRVINACKYGNFS